MLALPAQTRYEGAVASNFRPVGLYCDPEAGPCRASPSAYPPTLAPPAGAGPMHELDVSTFDAPALDELLDHALRVRLIDAYDTRGLCVVIRCQGRTYTSSRRRARELVHGLFRDAGHTPSNAS